MSEITLPGWQEYTLGDLGRYINGRAFKPTEWGRSGLPIIRIQNLTDPEKEYNYFDGEVRERHLVRDGDLLISWSATLGSFIWDRGNAALNQHIFKVVVNEKLIGKQFLHYLVLHILDDLASQTHGSTMKHITKGKFEATPVVIPGLDEQRRIVGRVRACLDRVDAVRQLRAESVGAAEKTFGAVTRSTYRELLASTPSEPLGDLVSVQSGKTPSKRNEGFWSGTVPWVSPKDMKVLEIGDSQDHVTELAITDGAAKLIEPPVVLVVVRGMILAHTLPIAITRAPLTINQDIKALTPSDALLPDFLAFMLLGAAPDLLDAVNTAGHGTKRLTTETILATPIPVPDAETQERIARSLFAAEETSRHLVDRQREQAEQEARLTQSVLARAFAGEL